MGLEITCNQCKTGIENGSMIYCPICRDDQDLKNDKLQLENEDLESALLKARYENIQLNQKLKFLERGKVG